MRWGCWAWEVWAVKQSMFGFAAGMGTGFFGGMVGIGGPPLFILYQYLGTPKEQVRAAARWADPRTLLLPYLG